MNYSHIDPEKIKEMLFNEKTYIIEFCEAGVISFQEFSENFSLYLLKRNMENLRKAGHKIRPGALMMGADEVVSEYEKAKKLLHNEVAQEELEKQKNTVEELCTSIQNELRKLSKSL